MENKHETGQPKVFENLAYGVRETEAVKEYSSKNRKEEKSCGWWSLCCSIFGY